MRPPLPPARRPIARAGPGRPAAALLAVLAALAPGGARAQQSPALREGIDHYWNARYESALTSLSEPAIAALPREQRPEALQYRAFSLVALGRDADAVTVFGELLELDPGVQLDRALVSPKILARFGAARGAAAAKLVDEGRSRYDAGDYAAALERFEKVLALDPQHTLATEYRQLCRARLDLEEETAKAARPAPEPDATTPAAPAAPPEGAAAAPEAERIYTLNGEIVGPVLERRVDPDYPRLERESRVGGTVVLLVVVGRDGHVEIERVLRSVSPRLDAAASRAVRSWRFRPALLGMAPVAVYKVVTFQFVP